MTATSSWASPAAVFVCPARSTETEIEKALGFSPWEPACGLSTLHPLRRRRQPRRRVGDYSPAYGSGASGIADGKMMPLSVVCGPVVSAMR